MAASKMAKIMVIALTITALTLAATTFAAITVNQNVGSTGTITTTPNIGVYSDSACTQNLTSITWGSIAAGSSTTRTVYVKNTGTGTLTLSDPTISNWNPTGASPYITISWDKTGTQLTAGQSTTATVTITVSLSITGITNFSNTITIQGTG